MSILPYGAIRLPDGSVRPPYRAFGPWLERTPPERIAHEHQEAERAFHRVGITFAVYGEDSSSASVRPTCSLPTSTTRRTSIAQG